MEVLRRLTRRQVDALQAIQRLESPERGAALNGIASTLNVRPPSALDHLTALEGLGLVTRHRGKTRLSDAGRDCLLDYQRHHRIAESLLQHAGLRAEETCRAAREIDLALSHQMITRIYRAGGEPEECPHGGRIPPLAAAPRNRRSSAG